MCPFGPFYPAYLQEAVDHAERLVELLEQLDPRSARRSATTWLVGRSEEVECLVVDLVAEWERGEVGESEAAQSLNSYLQGLHRGLAINFGELAPSCCAHSLVVTASPASYLSVTRSFPPSVGPRSSALTATWGEVEEEAILSSTWAPSSR